MDVSEDGEQRIENGGAARAASTSHTPTSGARVIHRRVRHGQFPIDGHAAL